MGFLIGKRASPQTNNAKQVLEVIDLLGKGYSLFDINRRLTDIPEVRVAVNRVAETVSMVPFYHIREKPVDSTSNMKSVEYINSRFQYVLGVRTNKFQSPQVFKTNIISRMLYNNNVFCLPEWDVVTGVLRAIYPLPVTTNFEFKTINGFEFVEFPELGKALLYSDIIHLQRFPDIKQGMRRQAVYTHTDIVASMQQAAVKQLEASGKIKALLLSTGALKSKDMAKDLEEFKKNFLTSQNVTGLGMMPGGYDLKNIDFNLQSVDDKTMKFLTDSIYNYCGISENIINHKASELENQQFINSIEPHLLQMVEEFTYKLFSDDEISKGNKIAYDRICLEIATLPAKTNFLDKSIYQGSLTRNEARQRIGLGWKEGGDDLLTNKNAATIADVNNKGGEKVE